MAPTLRGKGAAMARSRHASAVCDGRHRIPFQNADDRNSTFINVISAARRPSIF